MKQNAHKNRLQILSMLTADYHLRLHCQRKGLEPPTYESVQDEYRIPIGYRSTFKGVTVETSPIKGGRYGSYRVRLANMWWKQETELEWRGPLPRKEGTFYLIDSATVPYFIDYLDVSFRDTSRVFFSQNRTWRSDRLLYVTIDILEGLQRMPLITDPNIHIVVVTKKEEAQCIAREQGYSVLF